MADETPAPICPSCGQPAKERMTRYGVRHDCCGLWSWGGKPLVDAATHAARRQREDPHVTVRRRARRYRRSNFIGLNPW